MDQAAIAKAAARAAAQSGTADLLAKADAGVAARADAASVARGAASSAASEKAIAAAKAKHGAKAVEESDALAAKADAVPVAAVPLVAVAAPVLAVQTKPTNDAGPDADGSVAAVGTKRARRAMANQADASEAKAANAKTAQADGDAVQAGAAASVSKEAKLAAAAEAGKAIAAAVAAQAGAPMHGSGLHGSVDGVPVTVSAAAVAGSNAGGHTRDSAMAVNGGVVSGGAEASLPGHQVLSAGPTQLEVGVMDGTHGWLQIRAELGAGGSVATSLTGNAAAHAPLQQSVPEMTSYLASESVSVSGIAVHRASEMAGTMAWGQGQSDGQDAGGAGARSGGGSSTHDGKTVMDGAQGGSGGSGGSPTHDGGAVMDGAPKAMGLGWLGGVSPVVFARGFNSGGAGLAAGTGSWLSVRV